MFTPTPDDLQHMLALAKKQAARFGSMIEAEDLAQDGWVAFLDREQRYHRPVRKLWWDAAEAMMKAAWKWKYGIHYHPRRTNHPNVTAYHISLDDPQLGTMIA